MSSLFLVNNILDKCNHLLLSPSIPYLWRSCASSSSFWFERYFVEDHYCSLVELCQTWLWSFHHGMENSSAVQCRHACKISNLSGVLFMPSLALALTPSHNLVNSKPYFDLPQMEGKFPSQPGTSIIRTVPGYISALPAVHTQSMSPSRRKHSLPSHWAARLPSQQIEAICCVGMLKDILWNGVTQWTLPHPPSHIYIVPCFPSCFTFTSVPIHHPGFFPGGTGETPTLPPKTWSLIVESKRFFVWIASTVTYQDTSKSEYFPNLPIHFCSKLLYSLHFKTLPPQKYSSR